MSTTSDRVGTSTTVTTTLATSQVTTAVTAAMNAAGRMKLTVPPEYRGGESASRWFARFELCSRCNGWDEQIMYSQVLPLLSGDALDLVLDRDPTDISDYRSVKNLLIKEFDNSELREHYVQEFKNRRLKEGEEFNVFMRALKSLAKKAYPDFEEAPRNSLVADRYREEMPDRVKSVLPLLTLDSQDLDLLVSETRRLAKATDSSRSSMGVAAVSNPEGGAVAGVTNEAILRKLTDMQEHLSRMSVAQEDLEVRVNGLYSRPKRSGQSVSSGGGSSGGSAFGGPCWSCGKRGHRRKDCPNSSKSSENTNQRFLPHVICNRCNNFGHYASDCRLGNA